MTEAYELIPKYRRLKDLSRFHQRMLEPEFGERVVYQGQTYLVLGIRHNQLMLLDEYAAMPFDPNHLVYVDDWQNEDELIPLPNVTELLYIIQDLSTLFPAMTPGVESTREVWQIRHPNCDPVVARTLQEALLDMTIQLLEQESDS